MNRLYILLIAILFVACNNESNNTTEAEVDTTEKTVLTVGVVPQFSSKRIFTIWDPILKELEDLTGYQFKLEGAPSIPDFENKLAEGAYDMAYMNPYHLVVANEQQGYEAIVNDGSRALFGVLVTKSDSEFKDVKDLDGKTLTFPAPNALGASLLMRTELKNIHGIDIEASYVKTHTDAYMSVIEGTSSAGGGVMRTFNELNDEIKSQLQIFYKTQKTPPHPIALHPRLDAEKQQKIKDALKSMSINPEQKVLLEKIPIFELQEITTADYQFLNELGMKDFYVAPSK